MDARALVDLLNRVVGETTSDERRYAVLDTYRTTGVSVFFTHDPTTLDNYFSFARESVARHAETTEG